MDTNKFLLNKQLQAEKLKNLQQRQVPVSPDTEIPMTPAPLEDITPEQAAELDKLARLEALSRVGRGPASVSPSVQDMTEKSDMMAVPLEEYAPAGSYVGQKLGQQVSPDVTGTQSAPEVERLAKLKEMIISGRNPSSIEDQPTLNQLKKFKEGQDNLDSSVGNSGVPQFTNAEDIYTLNKMADIRRLKEIADLENSPEARSASETLNSREYRPYPQRSTTPMQDLQEWDISNKSKLDEILKNLKNQK